MKKIEAFIIDLGGVIIDIDYQATVDTLIKLSKVSALEELKKQAYKSSIFLEYEIGKIDTTTFFQGLRNEFQIEASYTELFDAWNAMLGDIKKEKVKFLKKLSKKKATFLLSNTNEVHLKGVEKILKEQTSFQSLKEVFNKVYYSFEMGKRKPNADIFQEIITEQNLKVEKTLFLDDSEEHIEGAKKVGLQTLLIPRNSNKLMELKKNL